MISVFADQYLHGLDDFLPGEVKVHRYDPAGGLPGEALQADALLIRTENEINPHTLPVDSSRVQFVGSGSAGTDHVDVEYLERNGIAFAHAPGCNARSVAEYVAAALLMWAEDRQRDLGKAVIGLVGAGNVGTSVTRLMQELGLRIVAYDPPRQERDPGFISAGLRELLECDILTFHVPLTSTGPHPTRHWLSAETLENRSYELIINTSRGGVIDEHALLNTLDSGSVQDAVIDVWEGEPVFNPSLAEKAYRKTPHIAGYSIQAKENASRQIAEALCRHFSLDGPDYSGHSRQNGNTVRIEPHNGESLKGVLAALHPILDYESELLPLTAFPPDKRGAAFNRLRAEFPLRDEFHTIQIPPHLLDRFPVLAKLGFSSI